MLALLLGCAASELSQPWTIDRTRVLAVKATPAEAAPGESVRLRALAVDPVDGIQAILWFGCLIDESSSFGCDDLELLGVTEPGGAMPTFETPTDLLEDLSEDEQLEGMNFLVQFLAVPNGVDLEAFAADESAGDDLSAVGESGYKRVPISLSPTPNDNPEISGLIGEGGLSIGNNDTLVLSPGQTYELEALLPDSAIQEYSYRNSDGVDEDRVEEPYINLYATEGDFDQPWKLYPNLNFEYTAPENPASESGTLWIVVRDRRGGMSWIEVNLRFE